MSVLRWRLATRAAVLLLALPLLFASGCRTRVVVIDSTGDPVRITDGVATVWTSKDGGNTWIRQGRARLPDGAYVGTAID